MRVRCAGAGAGHVDVCVRVSDVDVSACLCCLPLAAALKVAAMKAEIAQVSAEAAEIEKTITRLLVEKAEHLKTLQGIEEKTDTVYSKAKALKGRGPTKKGKKASRVRASPHQAV